MDWQELVGDKWLPFSWITSIWILTLMKLSCTVSKSHRDMLKPLAAMTNEIMPCLTCNIMTFNMEKYR